MPQTVTGDKEDAIVVHPQPEFGSSNGTVEKTAGDERPFRHSNEYRKTILKGLQPSKPNVLITKHGINGKSKENFELEAAIIVRINLGAKPGVCWKARKDFTGSYRNRTPKQCPCRHS